ncbi:sulfatase-like hydrolase/transferase [Agriterribacter sp.]|uniref:sulfatase family protein n=1 Tax=Agriterribacter sp. TaxID=2821509 RepID=UPI002BCB50F9|nr:sulfatase-like hydrolase/transferase [Agriterribacter sp.]HRP55321.1 sulfatase-like hydrolase/transferase [Agriterribacter sp.]
MNDGKKASNKYAEASIKPNFLIILTDDQTYRAIGYNNILVKTPNLDKLANEGIIFNRAYTSTPVCTASRASILTGLYPQTNGTVALNTDAFIRNIVSERRYRTLPDFLNDAGYINYFSGKSHLGDPKDYGFQFGEESFDYIDDKRTFQDVYEFINEPTFGQKPFLIWLAARQPHLPLKPAQKWLDLYSKTNIPSETNFLEKPPLESFYNQGLPGENFYRDCDYTDNYKNLPAGPPRSPAVIRDFTKAYYATISHLDFQIGELLAQLKAKDLIKNTVIIFLSDNGYFLGNHGLGNKLTMQEESVHIPFFIYWDKLRKTHVHSDALVSNVDILPTILDLTGQSIPDYLQGKSLRSLFSDPSIQLRKYIVSESVGVGGELGTGHRMVVTDKWKYILSDVGDEALFNLEKDPYELKNLIKDKPDQEKRSELKSYLMNWKNVTGDKKNIPDK